MRRFVFTMVAVGLATAAPAQAQTCTVDAGAMLARLADLQQSYGTVLSDIGCDAPTLPSHRLFCESAEAADDTLWQMARLDTLAWVYAYENATGQQVDPANPPLDPRFIATRDACTDVVCLCAVLIDHTNGSLGGTSPYPQ